MWLLRRFSWLGGASKMYPIRHCPDSIKSRDTKQPVPLGEWLEKDACVWCYLAPSHRNKRPSEST
jgi:hypothetical protein